MKVSPALFVFLILVFSAVPLCVFLRMLWLYWTRGRDPKMDSASVQYEPPDNLTPSECATLLENAVAVRDITATIVDLSVKGYLAVEQADNTSLPSPKREMNYIFHMRKTPSEWSKLKLHEQMVLGAILIPTNPLRLLSDAMSRVQNAAKKSALKATFSRVQAIITANPALRTLSQAEGVPRHSVPLLELQNQFYLHLTMIREAVFDALVAGGYFANRPDRIRLLYIARGIVVAVVMAGVGSVLATTIGTAQLPWILTGILSGIIILAFSGLVSARTVAGSRTLAKVLGFREFLRRVEKDKMERMERTPELFEKYLPYAMALNVERNWTQAFGNVTVPPPQWYQRKYGSGFLPVHFIDDLSAMSTEAGSVLTSKPNNYGDANPGQ